MTDGKKRNFMVKTWLSKEENDSLKHEINITKYRYPFARFCREKLLGKIK